MINEQDIFQRDQDPSIPYLQKAITFHQQKEFATCNEVLSEMLQNKSLLLVMEKKHLVLVYFFSAHCLFETGKITEAKNPLEHAFKLVKENDAFKLYEANLLELSAEIAYKEGDRISSSSLLEKAIAALQQSDYKEYLNKLQLRRNSIFSSVQQTTQPSQKNKKMELN